MFVEVYVEDNEGCPGCVLRFRSEGVARSITRIAYAASATERIICEVVGWSSEAGGTPVAASAVPVEDSGGGVSMLGHGGDWGLRLTPQDGSPPFAEPYLLLAESALLG